MLISTHYRNKNPNFPSKDFPCRRLISWPFTHMTGSMHAKDKDFRQGTYHCDSSPSEYTKVRHYRRHFLFVCNPSYAEHRGEWHCFYILNNLLFKWLCFFCCERCLPCLLFSVFMFFKFFSLTQSFLNTLQSVRIRMQWVAFDSFLWKHLTSQKS